LLKKNLDLIIVNDVSEPGAGFAVKTNRVSIIDREGNIEKLPLMDKYKLSHEDSKPYQQTDPKINLRHNYFQ
jgi:phosphopantothenoylcysteine synthetase/decarboxylase